jgi:hypothetical protein
LLLREALDRVDFSTDRNAETGEGSRSRREKMAMKIKENIKLCCFMLYYLRFFTRSLTVSIVPLQFWPATKAFIVSKVKRNVYFLNKLFDIYLASNFNRVKQDDLP